MSQPFRIRGPRSRITAPLIYDSPHSGRFYPSDFHTRASREELRRGEDAYVDELLDGAASLGVCVLDALYPRCYIDITRAETDIDAALLAEPWPTPLQPTEKSARGLGLIRRFVISGVEVNDRLLTVAEVRDRIDRVYQPYYAALAGAVEEVRASHGFVWHVNWHSMKSFGNAMTPDGSVKRQVDFVVSDLDGRSAAPEVTALIAQSIRDLGYRVSVNEPYKGGTLVQRIGAPNRGVHSVQIEINRALYLDEAKVEKTSGFDDLANNLTSLTRGLIEALSAR